MKILIYSGLVAGTKNYQYEKVALDTGASLTFKAEPSNPYDENAIEIYHKDYKLGYVPKPDTAALHEYLSKGAELEGMVTLLELHNRFYPKIYFSVLAEKGDTL